MIPLAKDVLTPVPSVSRKDPALRALNLLREHGVVVLTDDQGRPKDILTSCDLDGVRKKVQAGLGRESSAPALFADDGREVFAVRENDELTVVGQVIARRGLSTGIVVVDERGRYVGYVFNASLRDAARELSEEVREDVRRVEAQYPGAWSSLRSRLPT